MERLDSQNYYKLVDISSHASFEEVRSVYDQAMTIYAPDSISTCSLFTQKRELTAFRLAGAYKTLANSQLTKEYNHLLIERAEYSS